MDSEENKRLKSDVISIIFEIFVPVPRYEFKNIFYFSKYFSCDRSTNRSAPRGHFYPH